MRVGGGLLLALGMAAAVPSAALARDVSAAEQAALESRVAAFDAAMDARDVAGIMAVVPPDILDLIAASAGVGIAELRAAMAIQVEVGMETIKDFGMEIGGAEHRELADGTPYLLIPTTTVVDVGPGPATTHSSTLALLDAGTWYLLRIADSGQVETLTAAYPEFAGVAFPAARTETQSP